MAFLFAKPRKKPLYVLCQRGERHSVYGINKSRRALGRLWIGRKIDRQRLQWFRVRASVTVAEPRASVVMKEVKANVVIDGVEHSIRGGDVDLSGWLGGSSDREGS